MTPMQLGPTSAMPCAAGDVGDLGLHRGGGLATFDDAAARDDHRRDAGGRGRLRHQPRRAAG